VISGVIGRRKPHFDLWGDTVNTASRLESSSLPGEIQVDERTYLRLRHAYELEPRGFVELKGIGAVATYLLKGHRDGAAAATSARAAGAGSGAGPTFGQTAAARVRGRRTATPPGGTT
jgi:adenylate cyclase